MMIDVMLWRDGLSYSAIYDSSLDGWVVAG